MGWFRKGKRVSTYRTPPPPPEGELEEARAKAEEADEELRRVEAQGPAVAKRSAHLNRIHKINHIGPAFWDAVSLRRESP